jgi:hypothetical protein
MRIRCAVLIAAVILPVASIRSHGQAPPPILLDGRESVAQMQQFKPFLGRWRRIESPPGTPIPATAGGCSWTPTNHGMTVDAACGPFDEPAEATRIFWHPIDPLEPEDRALHERRVGPNLWRVGLPAGRIGRRRAPLMASRASGRGGSLNTISKPGWVYTGAADHAPAVKGASPCSQLPTVPLSFATFGAGSASAPWP